MNELASTYKKVMIIDDSEIDRYVASRNIKKYAFAEEVIVMESAKKGLEYLESLTNTPDELPNLILLDINMPEINGFGFLEEYEKFSAPIISKWKIMMLSSSISVVDHEKAKSNKHVISFVIKPLNKEKLDQLSSHTPDYATF